MTKEKLEKEAEDYADNQIGCGDGYYEWTDVKEAYLASAEPREKRIAELIALINAERKRQEKCDDVHLRKIAELEKENAELKDDNKVMADNYSKMEQKFYDNLTKAKELLERLLITSCNSDVLNLLPNCSEVLRVRVEAEQFLSEVEK